MSNRAISTELIELGERIRKRRQEMKLSQESFAEKAGISVNTVSRIEGGQTAMSVEIFRKMIEILEIDANILLGKEELAEQEFARQVERLAPLAGQAPTGKRCAFFSITANNLANVRKGGDYVAQMIEMAGGDYVFAGLTDNGNNLSTMNLPLEDFYAGAKDADVLLYNSTIEGVVHTTEELVAKCPLLAEFKAVQSGSVWCTTQSFFQQSTALVDFVLDLHRVFTENDPADLQFLRKVE